MHTTSAATVRSLGVRTPLLNALDGRIEVSAELRARDPAGPPTPCVAIVNHTVHELQLVCPDDTQAERRHVAPGTTDLPLIDQGGEPIVLIVQIGPVPAGVTDPPGAVDEVLTLVLSAERSATVPGAVSFVGQAIGGHTR
ncbi:MAG: hypothetical protein ACLP01_06270 [Solirubrobacteraceae bacterium]